MKTKWMVAMLMMATMTTTAMAQQQGRGKSVEIKKDMVMRQRMTGKDQVMHQRMAGKDQVTKIKDQRGFMAAKKHHTMSADMRRKFFAKQLRMKKMLCKQCDKGFHRMMHHHHHHHG